MDQTDKTEQTELEVLEDQKEHRRLKRLNQLALAREKALDQKKKRAAPKKELKRLKADMQERVYQDQLNQVEHLKGVMDRGNKPDPPRQEPTHRGVPINSDFERLVNILYT